MAYKSRVGDILLKAKVIDELQLRSAMAQLDQWGGRLGKVVADMGLADEDTIVDAISRGTGTPRVQLGNLPRDQAALAKLDVSIAEQRAVFPAQLKDNGKTLVLAMADPTDLELIDQIAMRARCRISAAVASETEINVAIMRYYRNIDPGMVEAPRHRRAVKKFIDSEEEDFQITDMSGKTVMKHISEVAPPPVANATASSAAPLPSASAQNASDILDEMLSGGVADSLSPEEMARLESVRVNQEKSGKILRAVIELLTEKGYLTPRDLQARIKT